MLIGLVGLGMGLWLLPRQHPDAALQHMLSMQAARHRALAFLAQQGYKVDTTQTIVVLRRAPDLLRRWQAQWGRPDLVRRLQTMPWLPAYQWVVYQPIAAASNQRWQVVLAGDGTIWAFRGPDAEGDEPAARAMAGIRTDAFDPSAAWGKLAEPLDTLSSMPGPASAVALARYHLQQTVGSVLSLRPDSVGLLATTRGPREAQVRFVGQAPTGDSVMVQVVVAASGSLRSLEVTWPSQRISAEMPLGKPPQRNEQGFSVHEGQDLLMLLTYVLLSLWVLVLFLRRLHRRLLDTQGPGRDAIVGGLAFIGAILIAALPGIMEIPGFWLRLLVWSFSTLLLGVLGATVVFFLASTSDALARDRWPEKLAVLTLLRSGQVRNVVVGVSLLRGVALGGILLGLTAGLLGLWPHAVFRLDANEWTLLWRGAQAIAWLSLATWSGMLLVYVLLAVAAQLPWRDAGRVVGVLTLLLLLVSVSGVELEQVGIELGVHALWGGILAWACWRYEPFCSGVGAVTAWLLWRSAPGWMAPEGPLIWDAGIVWSGIGLGVVLGWVGTWSRRSEKELPRYVPVYLQELARRERLERELEIARQAQALLLPRALPKVPGIVMTALCQPAYEVGGDYYDVFALPDGRLAIVVGDVSGKGIQAAFFMTLMKGHVRALSLSVREPAEVLCHLNKLFREQAPRGLFVTMIYGVLHPKARTLTLARAGHPPILHYRACDGQVQCLRPSGMGIGLADTALFDASLESYTLHLGAGDRVLFYTDGITEIASPTGARWGLEQLQQWLIASSHCGHAPGQVLTTLEKQLRAFAGTTELADDLTAILLEVTPVDHATC